MSARDSQLEGPPEKGIAKGEFFYLEGDPFRHLDDARQPTIIEAEEELETNDMQFKALKQDVLLQMFESGLQDDKTFPSSGNLLSIGNRTGYFACGRQNGLIYGKTELLRTAFEEAKPKTTASLKNALIIDLPETPTHVRFTSDEKSIIIAMPSQGLVILDCDKLQQKKSVTEATKSSLTIPPLLDIVPNPSPEHPNHLAYISDSFAESPYGNLFLFDISTQKSQQLDSQREYTCLTFSHEGDILMACTRSGEALYYNMAGLGKAPIRRPSPIELPEAEGDPWWIIQGVHWIDTWNQLVIYNPLTHPSDPPVHEYQAYIISNPSRLSTLSTFSFEFIKLSLPPVDAFGNTSLRPWFWFQTLHNWKPEIQDLVVCSVTAGSDIGLLARGNEQTQSSKGWRIWSIEDENRRAMVPYNMEKNEETIVAGMQLDFTATKKLEKPLYPDEDPVECDPLPILWVLNTSGQLAGWTVMYIPGIKAGERPLSMMPVDLQDQYWQQKTQARLENAKQIDEEEQHDRELWEKEWQEKSSNKGAAPASIQESPQKPAQPHVEPAETPGQTPVKPTPVTPPPVLTPPSQPPPNKQPTHPEFGKPSPFGTSTFGQTGQLGGTLPGLSSMYAGIASGSRTTHVFGQSTGPAPVVSSTPGSMSSGFAKYSSQPGQASGFLSGPAQTGSFLQNSKGGSFLSGGLTSSFLQGGQESGFTKAGQDQGFGKYISGGGVGTPRSMTTPSSFSDGGFLVSRSESSPSSPFGGPPTNSLSQRTQSLASPTSRTQSYDMLDDSETESEESTGDESESDEDNSVRVDALNFGDEGFNLDLDGKVVKNTEQLVTPVKNESPSQTIVGPATESPSSVAEGEYVKVGIPITPSPRPEKLYPSGDVIDITPSGRDKSRVPETSPIPISRPMQEQKPLTESKFTPTVTPAKQTTLRVIEKAVIPPDPFAPRTPPGKSTATVPPIPTSQPEKPSPLLTKEPVGRTYNPAMSKVELRPLVPVSGTGDGSSKFAESAYLSDAFRLVIGQVSTDLEKLSENASSLGKSVEYQRQQRDSKSAADLSKPDNWTFADLQIIAGIVETNMKSVQAIVKQLPPIDESIKEIEKSLKKMEAKKLELNRFVQVVKDPEIRESIYSRKLAPDFARQQKETRHALQVAEEKLKDLASALTILKADLADENGSFGVHSPSTAGIYRAINNVFSRLQILSAKVIALEKRVSSSKGTRISTPGAESTISRSSVPPTTPVTRIGGGSRVSPSRTSEIRTPGMNSSPGMRGSPLRKTMLDEKLDPWETEEIIRDLHKKEEFRKKIGIVLKGTKPLFTEASV